MSPSESTSGDQRLLATGADMGHLQPLLCLLSALAAASNQFASRTEVSVYDLGGNSSASILATPARRQLLLAAFPGARFATPPWSSIPAWGQLHPEASEESARKGHYAWKAAIVAEQLARAPEGACVLWLAASHWSVSASSASKQREVGASAWMRRSLRPARREAPWRLCLSR